MRQFTKPLAVCALLLVAMAGASAQTTFATITGSVMDASGAVVPGAKITVTNVDTNIKLTVESNAAGTYTAPQLKEGTYDLRAVASGFRDFVAQGIVLVARDVRRVDVSLEIGAVGTSVEVTAGATLIETETARIGDTKTADVIKTLPTNGRAIWNFLNLAPGVVPQNDTSVIRFSGSRASQGNWAIDGITFADGVDNTQIGPFGNYIESYQEVKLDIANNSAEFGSLGQVTLISKSGANTLHGSLFDYYQSPWFRARDPFALERGTGVTHRPGGSAGGPVFIPKLYDGRNKTFFFFTYETSRGSQRTQQLNPTVPPVPWRTGNFSALDTILYDPLSGSPFSNNTIPANRINALSQKLQERFYPTPNFGDPNAYSTQNYRETKARPYDPNHYLTVRGDHHFSDRDFVFGRFTFQRAYTWPYVGNLPTIGQQWQRRQDSALMASETHTFRPNLINEFRWGFSKNDNPIHGPLNGPQLVSELGLVGLAPDLPNITGILRVGFSGNKTVQGIGGNYPNYSDPGYGNYTQDFQDQISWFRNRHNFKAGFRISHVSWYSYSAAASLFGNVSFSGKFTNGGGQSKGLGYADFLLGIPNTASRAFPPLRIDNQRLTYDFFAQDEFKVNPRLTLSYGIRYELHPSWRENNKAIAIFDVNSGKIVVPDGAKISPIFPQAYAGVVQASSLGLPADTIIRTDRNNFAPRIGIAYRPWDNQTVFRAGYGIFYDVTPYHDLDIGGVPFVLNEPSYTNPVSNPDVIFPRVFPASGTGGPDTVSLPKAVNPDLRTSYSMQYNFTIERQQWNTGFRLSYVGTAQRKGWWGYNYNSPVPDARPFIEKTRPFMNYPEINYITNGAGHQYNGLSFEALRHLANGLYGQVSWTWARDRYDMDYNWDLDPSEYLVENPFDRHREVSVARNIPTHRLTANFVYQLPFGRNRTWMRNISRTANFLVGGWEISGIFNAVTGEFLTPFWTGPDPTGIAFTDSDPAEVTRRPDILRDPNLPSSQRSVDRWFDAGAFAAPQPGQFGTSSRGVIRGPGVNCWHLGLFKEIPLRESGPRLRWEFTATNAFNHPNWSNPATNISDDASVGMITAVGGVSGSDQAGARTLRTGLRLEW